MADGNDAAALRKQIAFLSSLITSHKTAARPNGKSVSRSNASLANSTQNKKWTRWKKDLVLEKNKSYYHNPGQRTDSNTCNQTERKESKDCLTSKTQSNHGTLNKSIPPKNNQATASGINTISRPSAVSENQTACNGVTSILKHAPQNKYKLNRNTATNITSQSPSKQLVSTCKNTSQRRKVLSPLMTRPSITQPHSTAMNKGEKSNCDFHRLKTQSTLNKLQENNAVRRQSTYQPTQRTIPQASKLKWTRKSATLSSRFLVPKKPGLPVNMHQSQTIPNTSKLKWRRKSTSHFNSASGKKPKVAGQKTGKAKLVHKSRYSLKRMDINQQKQTPRLPKSSHLWYGHRGVQFRNNKTNRRNQSFVARRLKYIAHGCQPHHTHVVNTNQRRMVNIHGMNYIVRSGGKTLQKAHVAKHNRISSPRLVHNPRQFVSVYGSRKSSKLVVNKPINTTKVNKILQRQNSVNKHKTVMANKILRRTIQNVQASIKKDNRKKMKSQQYCMFYNKFGKCAKQNQGICQYIHDPSKIAVCTRFLRGTCPQMDGTCLFSHKIDKEKMPICQYFLKGKCTRDDCPYSHVNVGSNARVCEDFLKGYCAQGFKCKKKHMLECEEFNTTGKCSNGAKCKLIHRNKNSQRKRYFGEPTPGDEQPKVKRLRRRISDGFLPLEDSALNSSDIENQSLKSDTGVGSQIKSGVCLQIRPRFTNEGDPEG